jgi:LCP family protein required for cell wall assembly
MSERPGGRPPDAPLPAHLDPRGRAARRTRDDERPTPPQLLPAAGRRGRVLRRLALAVVAVLLLTTVGALGALAYYDRQIERIPVPTLGGGADVDGGDVNYLLVGSDSREGLTEAELAEVRTGLKGGGNEGTLTDTIVLVHMPGGGGEPTLVSFPRDAFVPIPGHGSGRINSAYARGEADREGGGPALLVETVQQLSGLRIDHYLEVGFIAFLRITDALGGVEVDLCQPARDEKAAIDLPAGEQRLSGGDALGFVRQREGLPRGDLDRIERQQYFLGSVARQVLSPGTLLRPDRVLAVLDAVTSSVRADEDLSTFDLARLGLRLRGAAGGGLDFVTVPVADANARVGGASVVLLDEAALPGFFAGLSPQTRAEPPPTVQIAPSAIRLAVLNGTDRAGAAADAARQLQGQGYTVTRTGNADDQGAATSVVLHGSGRADSARTVAASVPGAQVRQDDSIGENGLVLVVGQDFVGVRPVTGVAPGQPAPPPPPGGAAPAPGPTAPPADDQRPCID